MYSIIPSKLKNILIINKNRLKNAKIRSLMLMGYHGVYWWNGKINFGDQLTKDIFEYFSIPYVYAPRQLANVASTGSILEHLPGNYSGAVLGSGFIKKGPTNQFGEASVYFVRGKLTKKRISDHNIDRFGDPGLLIDQIYKVSRSETFKLGIIPHYHDKNEAIVHKWASNYPSAIKIIDVQRSPIEVVKDIAQCKYTVSSSLHGIITSHALEIPCAWAKISDNLAGGEYKFNDYFSVYDTEPNRADLYDYGSIDEIVNCLWLPSEVRINEIKTGIYDAFSEFSGKNLNPDNRY